MNVYIYMVVASEEEKSLCSLEARVMLNSAPVWFNQTGYIVSEVSAQIERSAFIKWKLEVDAVAVSETDLMLTLKQLKPSKSYRLNWLDGYTKDGMLMFSREERREKEKQLAGYIKGHVNLIEPEQQYGICMFHSCYFIGRLVQSNRTWQQHTDKPRQYSTALSTRLARTVVNIAIPFPQAAFTFIDPCCGIGTVLLEAAALGVKAEGYDLNPVVLRGTRENLAHYSYNVTVKAMDMLLINGRYDAAVLDLPYNVCSVLPEQQKKAMILKLKSIAKRFVIISVEPIGELLMELNIPVIDYGVHYKGKFKRELFLCGK